MYLKKTPAKNGRLSLSAVQGYRDPETKKTRQRTVKSFGYVDELQAEYPDPIAHFTQVVAEMDAERLEEEGPQTITIHPRQKIGKRGENRKDYGDAVPLACYNALGIEKAVRNGMAGRKCEFDLNALIRLLAMERILHPGSKAAARKRAGRHFYRADLSESDVYRGLTEAARLSDRIVSAMNRAIAHAGVRDLSCGYYDCTNYFFESAGDDFRRNGCCKEGRRLPIVQMGLMQDGNGIPVDFRLFSGNTNDSQTLIDALPECKRAAGMGRVVTVADKGMNSSANIIATVARGDGFVFSQSIRGTKSNRELRKWVLSGEGYEASADGQFKQKSRQDAKKVTVRAQDSCDGHAHAIEVPVKIVAFWSGRYAERARRERERVLEKSRQLVANPGMYTKATHHGAAKYVKNVEFDAESGEVVETPRRPELDEAAIAADAECDGYYCIVTSETEWDDGKVMDTYKELWRIEETFKVTKSVLESRPVFVWRQDHIKAHFLTCYIALTILRLLEHALGHRHSSAAIAEDLRAQSCSNAGDGWWLLDHRTDLTDELYALIGEASPNMWMRQAKMKGLFRKGRKILWQAP